MTNVSIHRRGARRAASEILFWNCGKTFCLLLAVLAIVLSYSSSLTAKETSQEDADRAVRVLWEFGECVGTKSRYRAERILSMMPYGGEATSLLYEIADSRCLERDGELKMEPITLRGAIAEALFEQDFEGIRGRPKRDTAKIFSAVSEAELDDLPDHVVSSLYGINLAQCVIEADPAGVDAIFRSRPTSDAESAAFEKLVPAISSCIPAGAELSLTKVSMRGALAEGAYRITLAANNSTTIAAAVVLGAPPAADVAGES
jgi:hypothetical protein